MTRRNRPNAARRAKAADARRATVLNLLARLDRGELTPDERAALRDSITADHAALDTARQAQREHGTAMRRQARQLDAAHEAIEEAEQAANRAEHLAAELRARAIKAEQAAADYLAQLDMYRTVQEQQRPDRAARIRAFLAAQTAHLMPAEQVAELAAPEPDPAEGDPGICQYACTHPTYLHNATGCRVPECPCRAADHPATSPEVCCDCGSPKVTYHNYREQPFCWPCADGQPTPTTSTPEPRP